MKSAQSSLVRPSCFFGSISLVIGVQTAVQQKPAWKRQEEGGLPSVVESAERSERRVDACLSSQLQILEPEFAVLSTH